MLIRCCSPLYVCTCLCECECVVAYLYLYVNVFNPGVLMRTWMDLCWNRLVRQEPDCSPCCQASAFPLLSNPPCEYSYPLSSLLITCFCGQQASEAAGISVRLNTKREREREKETDFLIWAVKLSSAVSIAYSCLSILNPGNLSIVLSFFLYRAQGHTAKQTFSSCFFCVCYPVKILNILKEIVKRDRKYVSVIYLK